MTEENVAATHLGKKSEYKTQYDPSLLVFYPRSAKRQEIGLNLKKELPFYGFDVWNLYEISYLNTNGFPAVRIGRLIYSADTENIVESKSLKLYFNSFNNTYISSESELERLVEQDLKAGLKGDVDQFFSFHVYSPRSVDSRFYSDDLSSMFIGNPEKRYLDRVSNLFTRHASSYVLDPEILRDISKTDAPWDSKDLVLYTDLLKSNCLVTHQPDWGTAYFRFKNAVYRPSEEALLKYVVSYRNHNEFHEQCCERMFSDILKYTNTGYMEIRCHYTRRGGIDINPVRILNNSSESSAELFRFYTNNLCREARQ